jgi:protease-4
MGDVAASGGYYIVCPADTILASPNTITGSIGVVFTMPNLKELLNEKLGITTDVVKTNRHADLLSVSEPLDEEERAIISKSVERTYNRFVSVVAEGRNMTYEEVDAIGGGRVWSGTDAMEIGLIDMIGGLERAIGVAAEMARLETYRIQSLPRLEDPLTMIMRELGGGIKMKMIRSELGNQFRYYKQLQDLRRLEGIQTIMPFTLEVR